MGWILLAVPVAVVAIAVAWVIRRRTRTDAPTQPVARAVPAQLDRGDFERPDAAWLVVVFSSASCGSCADAWLRVAPLESPEVTVEEVEFSARRSVHDRYAIDAVPLVLVADREGVVRASFAGVPATGELWATISSLRDGDEAAGSGPSS